MGPQFTAQLEHFDFFRIAGSCAGDSPAALLAEDGANAESAGGLDSNQFGEAGAGATDDTSDSARGISGSDYSRNWTDYGADANAEFNPYRQ
jgi:hypothetical protein